MSLAKRLSFSPGGVSLKKVLLFAARGAARQCVTNAVKLGARKLSLDNPMCVCKGERPSTPLLSLGNSCSRKRSLFYLGVARFLLWNGIYAGEQKDTDVLKVHRLRITDSHVRSFCVSNNTRSHDACTFCLVLFLHQSSYITFSGCPIAPCQSRCLLLSSHARCCNFENPERETTMELRVRYICRSLGRYSLRSQALGEIGQYYNASWKNQTLFISFYILQISQVANQYR